MKLNREEGRTLALVLHDVNNAAQVSDYVVAMREGRILAEGPPGEILTPARLEEIFGIACDIVTHPVSLAPLSVPRGAERPHEDPVPRPGGAAPTAERLSVGYDRRPVVKDVTVSIHGDR